MRVNLCGVDLVDMWNWLLSIIIKIWATLVSYMVNAWIMVIYLWMWMVVGWTYLSSFNGRVPFESYIDLEIYLL